MSSQPPSRTSFYLDKRNGKVMGVCAGIAAYTGLDVTLVRIGMVAAIILGSGALVIPKLPFQELVELRDQHAIHLIIN